MMYIPTIASAIKKMIVNEVNTLCMKFIINKLDLIKFIETSEKKRFTSLATKLTNKNNMILIIMISKNIINLI